MTSSKKVLKSSIIGNILIVLPKFIGDAVNCTPALQLIKELYPEQKISLLVRPHLVELFSRDSRFNVIVDERFNSSKPISMFAQAKIIKAKNIHLAIIMRNSLSEALLCFFAQIKYRVGYAKNGRAPLLTHSLNLNPNHHYIYRYCRLINEPHGNILSIMPTTSLVKHESELVVVTPTKKSIGVYLGGKNKELRHYPHELALESLTDISKDHNCCFYLFGDPTECKDVQSLNEQLITQKIETIMLAGKTSVATMVDAIASLDLMISIDSSPMHIAAAFNIPLVSIVGLGTSPWSIVAPKTINQIALVANGFQLLEEQIIREIKPAQITKAVHKLLNINNLSS